jgi:hypothetical protein
MTPTQQLALALDPGLVLQVQGISPDPWQRDFLFANDRHILLNCTRGAGKSRATSARALHFALFRRRALILLISRAQRQAGELFRYVRQGYSALGRPVAAVKETETQIEFANGSRIISLPGKEATIRGFQGVDLLILDEAARIPDDLYASVSPMIGVKQGTTIALSTPFGQRGFFWREWRDERGPWRRFKVTYRDCPRLAGAFIDEERRKFGASWIKQEYECCFEAMEGLVYPGFDECLTSTVLPPEGQLVGGIDWGFRNPFAAVWGFLDKDDVLHIQDERYLAEASLHAHANALPKNVMWYADPTGPTEIMEFRAAGLKVAKGVNDIRAGIAAVTARLETGRLKVHRQRCPNLVAESRLYRYPSPRERRCESENPVDDHNHALGALRYLVSKIDARFMARLRNKDASEENHEEADQPTPRAARPWLRLDNEELWNS